MIRQWLIHVLINLAIRLGYDGWEELDPSLKEAAKQAVLEVEIKCKGVSGQYRRARAMQMLVNMLPQYKERDYDLAIDWAVRICTTR